MPASTSKHTAADIDFLDSIPAAVQRRRSPLPEWISAPSLREFPCRNSPDIEEVSEELARAIARFSRIFPPVDEIDVDQSDAQTAAEPVAFGATTTAHACTYEDPEDVREKLIGSSKSVETIAATLMKIPKSYSTASSPSAPGMRSVPGGNSLVVNVGMDGVQFLADSNFRSGMKLKHDAVPEYRKIPGRTYTRLR
ncbi:hypothetical protein B0H17DRAFT_1144343 [Mycena rosella]|uniref:Uncharacterized protein n=1 Tax=Mycena rosella TaxID=1033263 RepID=A0AAD7CTM0_MYCRO|nr:hypothetical protein B0H17DRAFT_1144343 [Mycena rosella]